jgi:hypothetical protein
MKTCLKRRRGSWPGNHNAVKRRAKLIRFVCFQTGKHFYKTNESKNPETTKNQQNES